MRRIGLWLPVVLLLAMGCSGQTSADDTTGAGEATEASASDGSGADLPDPLRVGLIPNVSPEEQRARYEPFGDHLADALGVEVELFVAANYAGVVTALASDRLDIAYLGGVTYVQAELQADVVPLVTEIDRETGTTRYLSAIVVTDEAPYDRVGDLLEDAATVAMGDVSSTSGSLYPRIMLVDAGADCSARELESCPPLEQVVFTGGHDAAAQAVLQGSADAAGLELRILRRLEREGVVPEGALRVLETREVEGYPWVGRTAVPQEARDAIVDAFQSIDDPDLLDLLRAQGYEAVGPDDYDEIRERSGALGLLDAG